MNTKKEKKYKGAFIDTICDWLYLNSKFWGLISMLSLCSIIVLEILFIFTADINPQVREEIDFLVIPFLSLFVFSIFWRGFIPTILSLGGSLSTYVGMFYIYAKYEGLKILPPIIISKLGGEGKIGLSGPVNGTANLYFIGGILALILCIVISFKPVFFTAKGKNLEVP